MPVIANPDRYYKTPYNTPLVVPALVGLLANDVGTGLTAVLVEGSELNGTVLLNSDGSFTFTPTLGFIGVGAFLYRAMDSDHVLSVETSVEITVGDPVVFAHQVSSAEGQAGVEGTKRGKAIWSVRADRVNRTGIEICSSPKLPQRGEPLCRYAPPAGFPYSINNSYEPEGTVVNPHVVVVLVEARQEAENPFLWTVTVSYEGLDDPTAELPDVSSQASEYQEYRTVDIYGRPVTNSALDPILGGMPVDASVRSITIVRNLPYDAWDMDRASEYENTLNYVDFPLGDQTRNGIPVWLPSGTVRLKRISEQRMVRSKAATIAAARFYWRVTAELVIDHRKFRPQAGAQEEPALHRWVVVDAGFNILDSAGKKFPILLSGQRPTEPQLLDGKGGVLANPRNSWPSILPPPEDITGTRAVAIYDAYSTTAGTSLTIGDTSGASPQGVLLNDFITGLAPLSAVLVEGPEVSQGTVTLNSNGSFVFTPAVGFIGYASFTYKATTGDPVTESAPMSVVIFVGAIPVLNAFERYEYADWSPVLDPLLFGW